MIAPLYHGCPYEAASTRSAHLTRKLRRTGIWKTAKTAASFLGVSRRLHPPAASSIEWDRMFGVETAQFVPLSRLAILSKNRIYGTHYEPISSIRFQNALGELNIEHRNFLFIDLGSGKGKAILLAAAYPYQRGDRGRVFSRTPSDRRAKHPEISWREKLCCQVGLCGCSSLRFAAGAGDHLSFQSI